MGGGEELIWLKSNAENTANIMQNSEQNLRVHILCLLTLLPVLKILVLTNSYLEKYVYLVTNISKKI